MSSISHDGANYIVETDNGFQTLCGAKTVSIIDNEIIEKQEHKNILAEFEAYIALAGGDIKHEFQSVKCDQELRRNLEWLRDCYLELYEASHTIDRVSP